MAELPQRIPQKYQQLIESNPHNMSAEELDMLPAMSRLSDAAQQAVIAHCCGGTYIAAYLAGFGAGAGLSRQRYARNAFAFFKQPAVLQAIQEYRTLQRAQAEGMREAIIEALIVESFFDPAEAYTERGHVKPMADMPEEIRKCITRYSEHKYGVNIEFVDRLKARAMLAELLGIGSSNQGLTVNIDLGDTSPSHMQASVAGNTLNLDLDVSRETPGDEPRTI